MIIAGLDCGYSLPGLSFVKFEDASLNLASSTVLWAGSFSTARNVQDGYVAEDDARRITGISTWLATKLETYRPNVVAVELPHSGGQSAMAIKGMAFASGLAVATLTAINRSFQSPYAVQYYVPHQTKVACTGDRNAEKEAMIVAAAEVWPNIEWPKIKLKKRNWEINIEESAAIADSLCAVLTYVRKQLQP